MLFYMIRNLLFDLGGVIIDIERQNCVDAFEKLGLPDADSFFGLYAQTGIFMDIEDGSIDTETFHAKLRELLPEGTSDYQIDTAFQRFITGIPVHRLQALRKLRCEGYNIYLLSNTNPIMWRGVIAKEFGKEGLRREDYFDGMITSFEARSAKPDHRIFTYTAENLGIDPADTLFFDDSQSNVDAARECGYQAVLVKPGTEFTEYLPR
ncbi:MAG: HAD family phosphatase [Muribaculaceae bacterium]|nr:HAD family phosphatase [Muribaculaceae bacterium]